MQRFGTKFIADQAEHGTPFLLEVATFAPHHPATPAPRDVHTFRSVRNPRTLAFNVLPENAPSWLFGHLPIARSWYPVMDRQFRRRVRAVQGVDRLVGALRDELAATGQLRNTVFVFSSDNGYHIGQYRLHAGKRTAFDTDIRVPLVITGPGIGRGSVNQDVVENIDLAPTFDALGHATTPVEVDGASLLPLLHARQVRWRTMAGIEYAQTASSNLDPDAQSYSEGQPPTYDGIRTRSFTYIRYANGEREFYDRSTDPAEISNVYRLLSRKVRDQLDERLSALSTCRGQAQCWTVAQPALDVRVG
jgi:arylsulfatase A-like enzyme